VQWFVLEHEYRTNHAYDIIRSLFIRNVVVIQSELASKFYIRASGQGVISLKVKERRTPLMSGSLRAFVHTRNPPVLYVYLPCSRHRNNSGNRGIWLIISTKFPHVNLVLLATPSWASCQPSHTLFHLVRIRFRNRDCRVIKRPEFTPKPLYDIFRQTTYQRHHPQRP